MRNWPGQVADRQPGIGGGGGKQQDFRRCRQHHFNAVAGGAVDGVPGGGPARAPGACRRCAAAVLEEGRSIRRRIGAAAEAGLSRLDQALAVDVADLHLALQHFGGSHVAGVTGADPNTVPRTLLVAVGASMM